MDWFSQKVNHGGRNTIFVDLQGIRGHQSFCLLVLSGPTPPISSRECSQDKTQTAWGSARSGQDPPPGGRPKEAVLLLLLSRALQCLKRSTQQATRCMQQHYFKLATTGSVVQLLGSGEKASCPWAVFFEWSVDRRQRPGK